MASLSTSITSNYTTYPIQGDWKTEFGLPSDYSAGKLYFTQSYSASLTSNETFKSIDYTWSGATADTGGYDGSTFKMDPRNSAQSDTVSCKFTYKYELKHYKYNAEKKVWEYWKTTTETITQTKSKTVTQYTVSVPTLKGPTDQGANLSRFMYNSNGGEVITASATSGRSITYNWYQPSTDTNSGGTHKGSGTTYAPVQQEQEQYYYVTASISTDVGTTTKPAAKPIKVKSNKVGDVWIYTGSDRQLVDGQSYMAGGKAGDTFPIYVDRIEQTYGGLANDKPKLDFYYDGTKIASDQYASTTINGTLKAGKKAVYQIAKYTYKKETFDWQTPTDNIQKQSNTFYIEPYTDPVFEGLTLSKDTSLSETNSSTATVTIKDGSTTKYEFKVSTSDPKPTLTNQSYSTFFNELANTPAGKPYTVYIVTGLYEASKGDKDQDLITMTGYVGVAYLEGNSAGTRITFRHMDELTHDSISEQVGNDKKTSIPPVILPDGVSIMEDPTSFNGVQIIQQSNYIPQRMSYISVTKVFDPTQPITAFGHNQMLRNQFISPRYNALKDNAIGSDPAPVSFKNPNDDANQPHFVWPCTQNMLDQQFLYYTCHGIVGASGSGQAYNSAGSTQYTIKEYETATKTGEELGTNLDLSGLAGTNVIRHGVPLPSMYSTEAVSDIDFDNAKSQGKNILQSNLSGLDTVVLFGKQGALLYGPFMTAYGGQTMKNARKEWVTSEIWALQFQDEVRYLNKIIFNFYDLYSQIEKYYQEAITTQEFLKVAQYSKTKTLAYLSCDTSDDTKNAYQELMSMTGKKYYRIRTDGLWGEWHRLDPTATGNKVFEVYQGDLNVVQLGTDAALQAAGNGNSDYGFKIEPQEANQEWTIYTRDVMLDGLPESLRDGVDKYHSNASMTGVYNVDQYLSKKKNAEDQTITPIQVEISDKTAEIMYDSRYNFYYNGGYIPPSQMNAANRDGTEPETYSNWLQETYTTTTPRPVEQQQLGILKCYYNGFLYVQEWEPISSNSPWYEPYLKRSRYKYRREGKDATISLSGNMSVQADDSYYSIEWDQWQRIDNCETVRNLGVVTWKDMYLSLKKRGLITEKDTVTDIDVVNNFFSYFEQPDNTIYYVLLDNSLGSKTSPKYPRTQTKLQMEEMVVRDTKTDLYGQFTGLPDVSLEKGTPRYLLRSFKSGQNAEMDPWGSIDYRIRFTFKYGILISNKNQSRQYLEFRDLGNISDKVEQIMPNRAYKVNYSPDTSTLSGNMPNINALCSNIIYQGPFSIVSGKPMRFQYKQQGSDFYYYKEGLIKSDYVIWEQWHSIDSRLTNLESRVNLLEWFIGLPPGVNNISDQLPPFVQNIIRTQQGFTSDVSHSYQLPYSFQHEISGSIALRYGYDPRHFSYTDKTIRWQKQLLPEYLSDASGKSVLDPFLSQNSLKSGNMDQKVLEWGINLFKRSFGNVPPQYNAVDGSVATFYDFTPFGWISELNDRTNILFKLFPMLIITNYISSLFTWIYNGAIVPIMNWIIKIMNGIRSISIFGFMPFKDLIKEQETWQEMAVPNLVTPSIDGKIEVPLPEFEDMRDDNLPDTEKVASGFKLDDYSFLDSNSGVKKAPVTIPVNLPAVDKIDQMN